MIKKSVSSLLLILLSPTLWAVDIAHGDVWQWSISGFGTLGAVYSTDNHIGYLRDISQRHGAQRFSYDTDTRLGLQTNFKWHDLELVAQGVTRHRYDNTYTPELMMGFVKIEPVDHLTVRAGRLLADLFMLSESRNIGYSYLTIRPPVEFLGQMYMNYFDGGDVSYKLPIKDSLLTFKAYGGNVSEKISMQGINATYDETRAVSWIYGFQVDGQWDDWKGRIGFSNVKFAENFTNIDELLLPAIRSLGLPQTARIEDQLITEKRWAQYYNAALSWSPSPFSADLGLSVITSRDMALIKPRFSGFFNLSYRIDDITPFASFTWTVPVAKKSIHKLPPVHPYFDLLNYSLQEADTLAMFNRHTFSLGLRYDMTENIDAKFQVDFSRGSRVGVFWENLPDSRYRFDGDTIVFGATLDFVF